MGKMGADWAHAVRAYLFEPTFADPRVADWPLVADWRAPAAISLAYLVAIPLGQRLMRDRPAFGLKRFAALHNAVLFSLSLYMAVETYRQAHANFGWGRRLTLWCNPVDATIFGGFSGSGRRLARVLWVHYLSKAYEFVDTLIMVLKKNNRQVSFLHVYHHASTFFPVWWAVVKYGPGGEAWFCCFLNSAIHVLMYGYYFLSSLGVKVPFKQIVTLSQMVQFLLFISQSVWHLLITDCARPRSSSAMLLVQCVIFFALFADFYRKAYSRKRPVEPKKAA